MSENIKKLTEDEYAALLGLQKKFSDVTSSYGEAFYRKRVAEAELRLAEKAIDNLDKERFEFIGQLQVKYGAGQINMTTGEFLPDKN